MPVGAINPDIGGTSQDQAKKREGKANQVIRLHEGIVCAADKLLTLFSLFIRYDGEVGNARTCVVSFVDSTGIRHSIEVAAESLYEAAALAVKEFRRHPWTDGIKPLP